MQNSSLHRVVDAKATCLKGTVSNRSTNTNQPATLTEGSSERMRTVLSERPTARKRHRCSPDGTRPIAMQTTSFDISLLSVYSLSWPDGSISKYTSSPPVRAITTCLWLTAHLTMTFLPGAFHSLTLLSALMCRIPSGYTYGACSQYNTHKI